MADHTRYPLPDLNTLPQDIQERIFQVQEKAGFIPNVFLAFARRPAEWRAFFAYHDALMEREESSLTKAEREMIVTVTSAHNECLYCVVAHGALVRIYEKAPLLADQLAQASLYRGAEVAKVLADMLQHAPGGLTPADLGQAQACHRYPAALLKKAWHCIAHLGRQSG